MQLYHTRLQSPFYLSGHSWNVVNHISKTELLTQKNRLKRRFFKERWSECRDSNPGPPAPKAGALPTAQHPVMKLGDSVGRILPNQARYQLRYTRIFSSCHYITTERKIKDFSVCGHLCGQTRFCAAFSNRGKSRKRRRHKALRRFSLPCPGYRHGTPKPPALPTALHPDMKFHNSRKIKFNTFFRNAQRFSTLQFWGVCGML